MRKLYITILLLTLYGGYMTASYITTKNNFEEYQTTTKHSNDQREQGYRIRLDALANAGKVLGLRLDSLADRHRDLVRVDSLLMVELKQVKGRYSKLTSDELRNKMIEEYEKNK